MTTRPRPTAELAARHAIAAPQVDDRAFRPGWLIETRLEAMLGDALITPAGLAAAECWRRDWEAAMERSHGPRLAGFGRRGSPAPAAGPALRLAALGRLREAEQALGGFAICLLELCVIRDASWVQIAASLGCSDKTARRWTAQAIAGLVAHRSYARRGAEAENMAQWGASPQDRAKQPRG